MNSAVCSVILPRAAKQSEIRLCHENAVLGEQKFSSSGRHFRLKLHF